MNITINELVALLKEWKRDLFIHELDGKPVESPDKVAERILGMLCEGPRG